ncbi:MAG: aminodeoxychorismate/anthranilate synthase component II [Phycisphaerales bacterium]|nr:MAG: aminodeoxychorismate/anthranilate synthase component II [Phycisphaerales bacterium]
MRLLVIDNYDSFTYNLVQLFAELIGREAIRVVRSDRCSMDGMDTADRSDAADAMDRRSGVVDLDELAPTHVVISPGPRGPAEAGRSIDVIRHFQGRTPILGVCLGHQCMVSARGGAVVHAGRVMHGKTSLIRHDGRGIFAGVPSPFTAARYHSLIADERRLPAGFEPSAWSEAGELMAVRDPARLLEGVQFHPESFMTEHGRRMADNFLRMTGRSEQTGRALCSGGQVPPRDRPIMGGAPASAITARLGLSIGGGRRGAF